MFATIERVMEKNGDRETASDPQIGPRRLRDALDRRAHGRALSPRRSHLVPGIGVGCDFF